MFKVGQVYQINKKFFENQANVKISRMFHQFVHGAKFEVTKVDDSKNKFYKMVVGVKRIYSTHKGEHIEINKQIDTCICCLFSEYDVNNGSITLVSENVELPDPTKNELTLKSPFENVKIHFDEKSIRLEQNEQTIHLCNSQMKSLVDFFNEKM